MGWDCGRRLGSRSDEADTAEDCSARHICDPSVSFVLDRLAYAVVAIGCFKENIHGIGLMCLRSRVTI